MTGLMIVTAMVILLVAALGPAHHRRSHDSFTPADPSRDAGIEDADRRRTAVEVGAVAQRPSLRATRLLEVAARGQAAIPMHRGRLSGRRIRSDRAA